MGINTAFTSGIDALWTAAADHLKTVVYRSFAQGTYQVSTGTVAQTHVDKTIKVFFVSRATGTQESDVYTGQVTCYIRTADLSDAKQDDKIIDHNGIQWNIASVGGEPDFFHELTLRR